MNHWLKRANTLAFRRSIALVALLALGTSTYFLSASAATLTNTRMYMSRQQANVSTGAQFDIVFRTSATGDLSSTDNEVRVIFPDGDDQKWCRTAGSLTTATTLVLDGGGESYTGLLGTLTATCAQGSGTGSAESNSDRFLITGVGSLAAATTYGIRLVANTAVLGTAESAANNIKVTVKTYEDASTVEDTSIIAVSLISNDQVVVTAVVDPTLSVELSANTAALGTLSTSNVNKASITSTVSTNALAGFVSLVKYDATLTSGSNTIPDTSGGTIVAGTSEYGASTSEAGDAATIKTWDPASCTTGAATSDATALSTTFQSWALASGAVSSDVTTLCFLASTTATQAPGTYTSTATLVTTAKF